LQEASSSAIARKGVIRVHLRQGSHLRSSA
jgi:hypothetical protein